ncbi:MAG: hypothetical protein H2058_12640 [Muricauda sp.]|nr:hypothetical protein [Allomuricauda sp.]MBA4746095.1 hypothetical protein [Allomuricauda sp.]
MKLSAIYLPNYLLSSSSSNSNSNIKLKNIQQRLRLQHTAYCLLRTDIGQTQAQVQTSDSRAKVFVAIREIRVCWQVLNVTSSSSSIKLKRQTQVQVQTSDSRAKVFVAIREIRVCWQVLNVTSSSSSIKLKLKFKLIHQVQESRPYSKGKVTADCIN